MNDSRPWTGRILMAAVILLPLVGIFAPLGVAPLGALAGAGLLAVTWRQRPWSRVPRWIGAVIVLALLWSAASLLWALDLRDSLVGTARLVGTSLAGLVTVAAVSLMDEDSRDRLLPWAVAAAVLTAMLLVVEYSTGNGLTKLIASIKGHGVAGYKSSMNRGATVLAMLVWPLALMLRRRHGPLKALLLVAVVVPAVAMGNSMSSQAALAGGLAAALLVALFRRWALRAMMAGLVVAVVGMPILAASLPPPQVTFESLPMIPYSAHHRLTIWTFTGQRIMEHPLRGWGMEASRTMPGAEDEIRVNRYDAHTGIHHSLLQSQLPLHPHNAILQWWLELGAVGAGLMGLLAVLVLRRIECLGGDRFQQAALAGSFAAAFMVSAISYGFWQSWWQASLWLVAAVGALAIREARP